MKKRRLFKKEVLEQYDYIIAKEQPFAYATESLQKAIINLEYVNVDKRYNVIQFTSSLGSEGKTTTLANLGFLLGREHKVLLIDLDLRKPKINKVFNVPNENGLNDYLLGKIELKEAIRSSKELNIDYIVSGEKTTAIASILNADKLKSLINELKEKYDYILVDAPPVLPVSDSLVIAKLVDGIIFVVAEGVANKKRTIEAVKAIEFTGTKIIGSIMTQVKQKKTKKDTYYYYYGE